MTVATRIATGTGVALAVLLIILAWDVALVDQLAEVNQSLSEVNFRASTNALNQARLLNEIDEFTRKYEVTRDPAYAGRLVELRLEFAARLATLRSLDLAPGVRSQVDLLVEEWESYWSLLSRYPAEEFGASAVEASEARALELAALDGMRQQLDRVTSAAQTQVLEQALRSAEVSERARRLSWSIAASALLLSVMILWLTIRSISRPLIQLTEGTQAVADGEFSVRLETRGRDELSRLAASFNQMVRRLGEAERAKKDFLSHVSHELKTPLASMYETNELLLEEIAGPLNAKQKRFLTLNLDSSRRLSAMISKLLDLSRMEAGAMEYDFRRHDLVELVRTVVAGFEARARDRGVRLLLQAPATPVTVRCDYDRLIQVMQNLIDNALKFSPASSAIEIRVFPDGVPKAPPDFVDHTDSEIDQMSREMVLLEVADSGPGIADDQKPLIFRRFHQIDREGREQATGGVGLGLAICGEITQAHQGWMGLRNNEGTGSVFMVALPVESVSSATDPAATEAWKEQVANA